eukprot:gb/GECG01002435.1/.p1 GENE.gb/GECG01002435.1/~~gb/GECG01002435.1/.p1  ORF type:complete len:130 (+),score=15.99 gb/GECG01002435.1/:1-390(+)
MAGDERGDRDDGFHNTYTSDQDEVASGARTVQGKNSSSWMPSVPAGYFRSALMRITSPDASATEAAPTSTGHQQDCMACKVTGSVGCAGVGAYLLHERAKVPVSQSGHRIALLSMSTGFFALSVYRAMM